ncbi:hypothetical protein MP228_012132 [Amoeboaphelidium protococcarum]|nr:hypothetical protein MP228_012132 [Amoeboaphelidium protococcarum]
MSSAMRRKGAKKGLNFTVMIAGAAGLGKGTFVNTLCEQQLILPRDVPDAESAQQEKEVGLAPYNIEMDEEGVKITLTIVYTPDFACKLSNESSYIQCLNYIETQYDEALLEETRIKRNPKFQDNRVHCLLYFIAPTGHALKQFDIEFMKRLAPRVNIIPVIAKADTLSPEEIATFKRRIMEDINYHKIPVFDFPSDIENDDEETITDNKELKAMMPFTVIGSEGTYSVNGKKVRGRQYQWGVAETDNAQHCDFGRLRYAVLNSHLQDLKDITEDSLYETYRTLKLSSEEKSLSRDQSKEYVDNVELRDELAKQHLIKEELLRKESQRLKEMETKVQNELEARRRDLMKKEQSLKDMESRYGSDTGSKGSAELGH